MEHGVVAVRYVANNCRFLLFRKNPKYPGLKLLQGQLDGVVISQMTYTFLFFCKHKNILSYKLLQGLQYGVMISHMT